MFASLSERGVGVRGGSSKTAKDSKNKEDETADAKKASGDTYSIQLRNAIGAVVDVKTLPFAPKYVAMSSFHAAAANDRTVYTWQFQSQVLAAESTH